MTCLSVKLLLFFRAAWKYFLE